MLDFIASLHGGTVPVTPPPTDPEEPQLPEMDVYFMAGQSLAEGKGYAPHLQTNRPDLYGPLSGTLIYNWAGDKDLEPVNAGVNTQSFSAQYFGAEVSFSALRKSLNSARPFVIGKFAQGGTSLAAKADLNDWHPTTGELSTTWVNMAKSLLTKIEGMGYKPVIKCLFWMQGESDSATNYVENMHLLVDFWDTEIPALQPVKWVICHVQENSAGKIAINDAKDQHAATNPTRFLIQSERVQDYPPVSSTDTTHVNWQGCVMMGEDWFNIIHPTTGN